MSEKIKKACIGFLVMTVFFVASACGREERQRGIDGCIYEAELVPDTEDWGSNFKKTGNWLYYIGYGPALYRMQQDEDGNLKEAEKVPGGEGILDYTVDGEENIYCYKAAVQWTESDNVELDAGTLTRYREDGSQDFQVSFKDGTAVYASLSNVPGFLAAGGENRVFLLRGDKISVIDGSGKTVCEVDISTQRPEEGSFGTERLLEGGDGRVYYLAENTARQNVYEIVETGSAGRLQIMSGGDWTGKESNLGRFYGSPHGMLYSGSNGILQQYSLQEEKWRELLRWNDSNLWQDVQEAVWISEDRILARFDVHMGGEYRNEFYLLNKRPVEELPEKEELILACQGTYSNKLEDTVILFNRSNSQYHITIQVYEGEDAFTRLDASLVSSSPPDLLDLSGLDVVKYGGKQALEDLSPYLEGSGLLRREDFLEGILDGYTVDGRLVGIPSSFICHTLLGNSAETGFQAGWKMEDMVRLTEKYPGRKLNGRSFYRNLDTICGDYILKRFADTEKGECDFDSEAFCSLMVWLAEHSGSGTDYYAFEEVEDPLIECEEVGGILDFLRDISRSEKDMAMVGYPSMDGTPLHRAWTYDALGITAKSGHRDGAWQFIEYFLSQGTEQTWQDSGYMPSRRSLLEGMLEDAMTPAYLTIDGEVQVDAEGNPVEKPKWEVRYAGESLVKFTCATQEEADRLLDMIAHTDFSPEGGIRSEMISIISEEMDSYFSKDKSMEEVAEIIQNRVSTLVQENLQEL